MQSSIFFMISIYCSLFVLEENNPNHTYYVGVVDRIEDDKAVILIEEANGELLVATEKFKESPRDNQWFLIRQHGRSFRIVQDLDSLRRKKLLYNSYLIEKLHQNIPQNAKSK